MNSVYEINHVRKTYKKGKVVANDDIHFNVEQGEILGLLGPNGAGKSTLIKQMVGHLKPCGGEILFMGTNVIRKSSDVARQVAYYAQEPHALTGLKVGEVLQFTGLLRGLSRKEATRQTKELLDRFEMGDLETQQLKHISGGQKRMIGIGTTLIGECPVYILDEPTNELDPKKRRLVWNLIQERNRGGATIILVTHNVLEAEQVVNRVAVINHGKLLAVDHVSKLKQTVDQRLKLELSVETGKANDVEQALAAFGIIQRIGEHRIRLLLDRRDASSVMERILNKDFMSIEDFALVPPSLEDVYFHIDEKNTRQEVAAG
ncbi:ABC transporter ATP-binding protein [Paenibacillus alkalitolerans]|uniref:ABC transporter ATP-binding protein n=1 Tax=Paenibacillus alkalitolerans TaxID=2799335 RepID=UPI0018F3901C|nr:ABC transporter ATP-binding protein [Paenibacillus alkalitolerans]